MNVTMRCLEFGVYDVRAGRRFTQPVRLRKGDTDWQLFDGDHGCWRFTTFAEAKTWLNGVDGRAWLDQLPRAEVTA